MADSSITQQPQPRCGFVYQVIVGDHQAENITVKSDSATTLTKKSFAHTSASVSAPHPLASAILEAWVSDLQAIASDQARMSIESVLLAPVSTDRA